MINKIREANKIAVERLLKSKPVLVGIGRAVEIIPGMDDNMILHAGPPLSWDRMCGPMKGAIAGALIYEGRAENYEDAVKLAKSGEIKFEPCHHHSTVGPMTGVVSPSMPVFIIENETYGNKAFCTMNEGLGKVLRFGAYSMDVIERLKWMEKTLYPALKEALKIAKIDLKQIIAKALHMGDECHNRNVAATSLFLSEIVSLLLCTTLEKKVINDVVRFIKGNPHFFLNLSMPACKSMADQMAGIEYSTIVTAMARNGVEFGIRISSLGDEWFTAPAPMPIGLYFPGYSEKDANPDLGDSTITETAGLGGFAMAAAPAIVQFTGGSPKDALNATREMREITVMENPSFSIPMLDFRGTPTGIDLLKVVETGITPRINTGIAHKEPGIGQIGAGLVRAPMECFKKAIKRYVEKTGV